MVSSINPSTLCREQELLLRMPFELACIQHSYTGPAPWLIRLFASAYRCKRRPCYSVFAIHSRFVNTNTDKLYRSVPQTSLRNPVSLQLTAAALAAHTTQYNHQAYIAYEHDHAVALQKTASSLGASLPLRYFEQPKSDSKDWLEVQKSAARQ